MPAPTTCALVQLFYGEVTVDHSDHDVVMARFDGSVHDHDAFVEDAGLDHGLPAGA